MDQRWHADETDRILQEAAVKTILTHGASGDRLAAVSFSHEEEIHQVCDGPDARYLLAVDALHRPTSLIENQPIGLTFSIIERSKEGGPVTEGEFLRSGHDILCAGLSLFGPTTILLVSTGEGVDASTLDREVGNFVLTSADMTLPSSSDVLAIDLSHADTWSPAVRRYVDERIRSSQTGEGRPAIMRWNNSAVLGAFRAIMNGGIFLLPALHQVSRAQKTIRVRNRYSTRQILKETRGLTSWRARSQCQTLPTQGLPRALPIRKLPRTQLHTGGRSLCGTRLVHPRRAFP